MITEWFLSLGYGVTTWFASLFPSFEPGQIINASGDVAGLATMVGSMSVWVNWAAIAFQVAAVGSFYFTFLAVRIFRALLGHLPLVGGNG